MKHHQFTPSTKRDSCWRCRQSRNSAIHKNPKHNYVPGTETHAMHTDPLCETCGGPKNDTAHD